MTTTIAVPPIADAITVTLTRQGTLHCRPDADHTYQCGTTETDRFFYRAELVTTARDLDARGFMIDQADVDAAFQRLANTWTVVPSCELMAAWLCQEAVNLVGPSLRRVTVNVSGDPNTRWMSATWQHP